MEIEVIELSSDRESKAQEGLSLAIRAARKSSSEITVLVGAKRHFPSALVQYFLTEYEADLLKSKEHVVLQSGVDLLLESGQTIGRAGPAPVILVVYGWSEIIPKVKKAFGTESLIVLAPNEEEAEKWLSAFNKT